MSKSKEIIDLDSVLNELGEFGFFQMRNFILLLIPVIMFSSYEMTYIFATGRLDYRCKVPQCETTGSIDYTPNWLHYAIPFDKETNKLSQCEQYAENNDFFYNKTDPREEYCTEDSFNKSVTIKCNEFLFETDEVTMVNAYSLTCTENEWKLSLACSMGYIACVLLLPFHGMITDRFGRRTVIISSLIITGTMGIIKSFSTTYLMYIILEFFVGLGSCGAVVTLFVMSIEWMVPGRRAIAGLSPTMAYTFGQILLATVAMYVTDFRNLLRILYGTTFFILAYMWTVPESIRWQLSRGHTEAVEKVLRHAEKLNGVKLSESIYIDLAKASAAASINNNNNNNNSTNNISEENNYKIDTPSFFQSKRLVGRVINLGFCYFMNSAIYLGLNMNSVLLGGNKYTNYIIVSLVEIPAIIITYFLMQWVGRRWQLCVSIFFSAIFFTIAQFLPMENDHSHWHLILFVCAKICIMISYSTVIVYASEMFPTPLRQSYVNACSVCMYFAFVITPQISLLTIYMPYLPVILYGAGGITSALLILLLPETFNKKLPDTIEEAENIGN